MKVDRLLPCTVLALFLGIVLTKAQEVYDAIVIGYVSNCKPLPYLESRCLVLFKLMHFFHYILCVCLFVCASNICWLLMS